MKVSRAALLPRPNLLSDTVAFATTAGSHDYLYEPSDDDTDVGPDTTIPLSAVRETSTMLGADNHVRPETSTPETPHPNGNDSTSQRVLSGQRIRSVHPTLSLNVNPTSLPMRPSASPTPERQPAGPPPTLPSTRPSTTQRYAAFQGLHVISY